MVNDEASGVIKISDAVVQRLKGEISGEAAPAAAALPPPPDPSPPPPPPPVLAPPPPPPKEHPPPESAPPPCAPPASHVWQRPIIQYIEEPSLSALRVRAEKEEELTKLEQYWRERLASQEAEHVAQAKLTAQCMGESARLVEGLFVPAAGGKTDTCRDASNAVQSCYSSNPSKPLLCREAVLQFSQCVHSARRALLSSSG